MSLFLITFILFYLFILSSSVMIFCPVVGCTYQCSDSARFLCHVRSKHKATADLSVFDGVAQLSASLCRCPHCHHICMGANGLSKHRGQNGQCKKLSNSQQAARNSRQHQLSQNSSSNSSQQPHIQAPPEVENTEENEVASVDTDEVHMVEHRVSHNSALGFFSTGLYTVHRKWRKPLYLICARLMKEMMKETTPCVENATFAFLLLPGLLMESLLHHRGAPLILLKQFQGLVSDPSPEILSQAIINVAYEWLPSVMERHKSASKRSRSSPVGQASPEAIASIKRRLERLVRDRRLSAAMVELDKLQDVQSSTLDHSRIGTLPDPMNMSAFEEIIAELNPASDEYDLFTDEQKVAIEQSTALEVESIGLVSTVLKDLPIGSAAGSSGWTFGAIRAIFYDPEDGSAASYALLQAFCNRMLSGALYDGGWLRSRSVLIPKKDSSGWRPLSIGEAWYRFVGRVAMKLVGAQVGQELAPIQLGCGIKGGCEIAGRMAPLIVNSDSNVGIISLDIANAFGTIPRELIMRGILKYVPELSKWFAWAYGCGSLLLHSSGTRVGFNSTGCRQGDPLAGLCFCVGFQFPLQEIQEMVLQERHNVVNLSTISGVFAYMDDCNIFVDRRIMNRVAKKVCQILETYRMKVATHKSRFYFDPDLHEDCWPRSPFFEIAEDGLILMGAPTGHVDFCIEKAGLVVDRATSSLPAMQSISPWASWNLLRYCVTARVGYLARVLEPEASQGAFTRLDEAVDATILSCAGVSSTTPISEDCMRVALFLRSLPLALGGLGIARYSGLAGEKACLLSRQLVYEFIEQYHPEFTAGARLLWNPISLGHQDQHTINQFMCCPISGEMILASGEVELPASGSDPQLTLGQRMNSRKQTQLGSHFPVSSSNESSAAIANSKEAHPFEFTNARAVCQEMQAYRSRLLVEYLSSDGDRPAEAVWYRQSCFKGSGRWLSGPGGCFFGRFAFTSHSQYRAALRMRLLLSPAPLGVGASRAALCSCGEHIDVVSMPFHALDCSNSNWYHIHRHNNVRDVVYEFLQEHCKDATVFIEPPVENSPSVSALPFPQPPSTIRNWREQRNAERAGGTYRADIGVFTALRKCFIDVAVCNPAAATYRALESSAPNEALHAAVQSSLQHGGSGATAHREVGKRATYRHILGDGVDDIAIFVPFVVEATGQLGPAARAFLNLILANSPSPGAKSLLIAKIGAIIARNNALMAEAWAKKLPLPMVL